MVQLNQKEKAELLLELHKNSNLLILPNIWNPIGARILELKGHAAAATASAAISAMFGYRDGENIKLSTLVDMLKRIADSVGIPVTADIEAGYAVDIPGLKNSMEQVIETGIAGINFEDSFAEGESLRSISEQCERITAIREVSEKAGLHLVINARTDCFLLKSFETEEERIDESIKRLNEYINAGADCTFPVGAKLKESLLTLRKNITAPINVIASPGALPLDELQKIGINRVSFGPFIFRSLMKKFEKIAEQLKAMGSYDCYTNDILTYNETAAYLRSEKEK